VPVEPLPQTGEETGIDVGLKVFLITADGEIVENPRHYRKAEKQLAKAQRRVSRRKQGSKRHRKAVHLLRRKHQHVQRQRRDFHHKTALYLLKPYDTICLEDLQVRNMVRNHHLAKSISDASWGHFRTILAYKAERAAKRVMAVPPAYTTRCRMSRLDRTPGVRGRRRCRVLHAPAGVPAPRRSCTYLWSCWFNPNRLSPTIICPLA
jgi:putative transposase